MKKKNSKLLIVAATVAVVCAGIIVFVPKSKNTESNRDVTAQSENSDEFQMIDEGESLKIPVKNITAKASFYGIEVDGTQMEVLALKDDEGNIRTAFNTCQVCYASGNGYYVQDGDYLVCQNCGNRFTSNQVEVESGGCNPVPIFDDNKKITEDTIEIPYEFLKETTGIFDSWKSEF